VVIAGQQQSLEGAPGSDTSLEFAAMLIKHVCAIAALSGSADSNLCDIAPARCFVTPTVAPPSLHRPSQGSRYIFILHLYPVPSYVHLPVDFQISNSRSPSWRATPLLTMTSPNTLPSTLAHQVFVVRPPGRHLGVQILLHGAHQGAQCRCS
jgi:hypothetical protein